MTTDDCLDALELTILLPCLNEAETIEICVDKAMSYLASSGVSGEVLVADNGSTDGSQQLAAAKGARVVQVRERGYGSALRNGILAARGRYVVMGDADDSYDLSDLGLFVVKLREGHDVVMGNRFRGGIAPGAMPFLHRYLGNPVLSFLGRLFFAVKVGDFHCGLRAFNRERVQISQSSHDGNGVCERDADRRGRAILSNLRSTNDPEKRRPITSAAFAYLARRVAASELLAHAEPALAFHLSGICPHAVWGKHYGIPVSGSGPDWTRRKRQYPYVSRWRHRDAGWNSNPVLWADRTAVRGKVSTPA